MGDLKTYTFSRENAPADFKALNKGMEATNTGEAIPTLSTRSSLALVDTIDSFDIIEFTAEDIVRSGLVKSYILAKNDYFDKNKNRVDTLNY